MTTNDAKPLPHPDDAGPPCAACHGRGWVPHDDVPRAVCGTCDGTGYPQSWAAQEIRRLDAEVSRLRTAHASALARAEAAEKERGGFEDVLRVSQMLVATLRDGKQSAERERDEARAERDEARRDFDAVVDERNAMTSAAASLRERVRKVEEALREVGRRASLPVGAKITGVPSDPATIAAAIRECASLAIQHVSEPARALLAPTKGEEP